MRTASHRHCHKELHSHAEAQGGHQPRRRRAAGRSRLAPPRCHMRAANPPTRGDRSDWPQGCFRRTPATHVRRTSRELRRDEAVAERTRIEWMGEHGMVAGMGWRAPRQLNDDLCARHRRRDRRPASCAHACAIERAAAPTALPCKITCRSSASHPHVATYMVGWSFASCIQPWGCGSQRTDCASCSRATKVVLTLIA